ncbi:MULTISPECIES: hypothetical protein [Paraburkholderia]|uniref:hypothetical protein n=1 Tax=Paraburkholderia TaxID=1822464 RepID=UPI0022587D2C|nr:MULTISPECIES: hypothetical protein [Paraburkholderia]MCX4152648.1 hypothetical protein [Paraburkholderia aspalathi]MDN7162063.1 hypothetical protein [Paraburkholderia sp. SECH2]MDQ6390549.1 hypothetical protein [Paraburkholderia aspalathi]
MNFFPHISVKIPRNPNGLIAADKQSQANFWEYVDNEIENGLSGAIGCYIFSIRAGKGVLPWYVGLAMKQSFRKECFTSHKLLHYNNSVAGRKGTPLLTLIPKYTPNGRLVCPTGSSHRDIEFLETMLISNCLSRNRDLCNKKDTKLLREMIVSGFLNTPKGKVTSSVSAFRILIGV